MSIKITLSEEEVTQRPNNYELGEYVQNKFWDLKKNFENGRPTYKNRSVHDLKYYPSSDIKPWTCSICGKDTSAIEPNLLLGYDHSECLLKEDPSMYEKDKCVICGKETPYLKSTNIYQRIGYVEGCGQTCYQPNICG